MIPTSDMELSEEIEITTEPSKNYKMNIDEQTVNGYVDELSAMKQVVFKILSTERYNNIIYTWNYGIELSDLIGKNYDYVIAEAQRRITEALTQDERIESVDNFTYVMNGKNSINFSFTVHTKFGDVNTDKAIEY